jgi:uncharacterized membrane protein SirB2
MTFFLLYGIYGIIWVFYNREKDHVILFYHQYIKLFLIRLFKGEKEAKKRREKMLLDVKNLAPLNKYLILIAGILYIFIFIYVLFDGVMRP